MVAVEIGRTNQRSPTWTNDVRVNIVESGGLHVQRMHVGDDSCNVPSICRVHRAEC